jgi:hypothetical protein
MHAYRTTSSASHRRSAARIGLAAGTESTGRLHSMFAGTCVSVFVCVCVCVCLCMYVIARSYEDTCVSYEEEDTCVSYAEDTCMIAR